LHSPSEKLNGLGRNLYFECAKTLAGHAVKQAKSASRLFALSLPVGAEQYIIVVAKVKGGVNFCSIKP